MLELGPDYVGVLGITPLTCWHPGISLSPHPWSDMSPGSNKESRLHGDRGNTISSLGKRQRAGRRLPSFNSFQIYVKGVRKRSENEPVRPGRQLNGASLLQSVAAVVKLVSISRETGPGPGEQPSEGSAFCTQRPGKGSTLSGNCSLSPWLWSPTANASEQDEGQANVMWWCFWFCTFLGVQAALALEYTSLHWSTKHDQIPAVLLHGWTSGSSASAEVGIKQVATL